MSSPDSELYRLRNNLYSSGWEAGEIDQILDQASKDVNELILDVVENAVAEAIDYAQDLGAEEFIAEMDIQESGGYFQIWTISGKTDYSEPVRQMLPDLLKNGSQNPNTGNINKVIPIGGKDQKILGDIFSVMQDRQKKLQEARESLVENNLDKRSARASHMASSFRSILQRNLAARQKITKVREVTSPTEFRTASSKQDPSESWVYPAKEMDMTGFLMDLNSRIANTLESAISQLISSYIEEYR